MSGRTLPLKKNVQPIDRVALVILSILSVLIGILLLSGDRTAPRVREFSWDGKQIGAEDTAFIVNFSRPMDRDAVEANLTIEPPIQGKFSWAGRRMAFTPLSPVPYGNDYQVKLEGAHERLPGSEQVGTQMEPFSAAFSTRDRIFAYVGVEGEQQGKLVLYNLTQQEKTVLTPPDLVVMDFHPYPDGDRILFSAAARETQGQGVLAEQLYTVTTGLSFDSSEDGSNAAEPPGRIDLVLDSKDYQNLKFDLSPDGETIVVQRVNRRNPAEFGLWIVREGEPPKPLDSEPGGDFLITPDGSSLAVAQGQGVAILPLQPDPEPLDFLPKFGMVLSFARDGTAAAMVKFNTDYTRSLFLVNNQGIEQELLRTTGSILNCEFAPDKEQLYCLLTQLIEGDEYREEPFIATVDLDDETEMPVKPLVVLPEQRDIQMSLSPDGLALLFDQLVTRPPSATDSLRTNEGQAIADGLLWILPLADIADSDAPVQVQPEQLLSGFKPRWFP
jgi:hypothetical protein